MQKTVAALGLSFASAAAVANGDGGHNVNPYGFDMSAQAKSALNYLDQDRTWCSGAFGECATSVIDKAQKKLYLVGDVDGDGHVEAFFATGVLIGQDERDAFPPYPGKKACEAIDSVAERKRCDPYVTPAGFFPGVNVTYYETLWANEAKGIPYPYGVTVNFLSVQRHDTPFVASLHGTLFSGDEENIKDGPAGNNRSHGCVRLSLEEDETGVSPFDRVRWFYAPSSNRPDYPSVWDVAQDKHNKTGLYPDIKQAKTVSDLSVVILPQENTNPGYTVKYLRAEIHKKAETGVAPIVDIM